MTMEWGRDVDGLSVVSYNLLGHYAWYWQSSWELTPDTLPWSERLDAFDRELGALNADVICCQEVTQDMFASLLSRLVVKGYLGLLALRHLPDWTYNEGWETSQLGLAIFYKHTKLEVSDSSHRFARDFITKDELAQDQQDGISRHLLRRQDSVLMCRLRWRRQNNTPEDVIIACAHAVWWYDAKPDRPIACKPVQMMLMQRALQEFAETRGCDSRRLLLCGDFNTMPKKGCSLSAYDDTAGYELFTAGSLPTEHPEHPCQHGWNLPDLAAPYKLRSAYQDVKQQEPPFTTRTSDFIATIDYIFVAEGIKVTSVLPVPEDCGPCPSKDRPSDHLPIGANLQLL